MWNKVALYYHTLKFLKWKQIKYQIYYRIRNALIGRGKYSDQIINKSKIQKLRFQSSIESINSYSAQKGFSFLNLSHFFSDGIDWNYSAFGKLWTYNLNYFEFLLQNEITKEEGINLIEDFISKIDKIKDGLEPYPISLRIIFWIRFITKYAINNAQINQSLFAQTQLLSRNIEYHLMGNHLLENGFALLFGAYYFNNKVFYKKAKQILVEQLEEQILEDGGHFELSPMYHQIILYRILDATNLVKNNRLIFGGELEKTLSFKSAKMLGWLQNMSYRNGEIPLLNDSAQGIVPKSKQLFKYANSLGINPINSPLNESGYRVIRKDNYECVIDVGAIGPDYIPGHAHCDILNFCLNVNDKQMIVDTGLSTYEKNERRQKERSTSSHNTVLIGEIEQSEVWGGFRVGRRANPKILDENETSIFATHDGYNHLGINVERRFFFYDKKIEIKDFVKNQQNFIAKANFHFHPSLEILMKNNLVTIGNTVLKFKGASEIKKERFEFAPYFNKTIPSNKISITFEGYLKTIISV